MTYTILHKTSGRFVPGMRNISIEDFCNFCTEHAHEMKFYDVKTNEERKEVIFRESSEELELFKKSMNPAQINDVHLGNKVIKFNSEIGYYLLRVKKSVEYNISLSKKGLGIYIERLKREIAECSDIKELGMLANELSINVKNACTNGNNND